MAFYALGEWPEARMAAVPLRQDCRMGGDTEHCFILSVRGGSEPNALETKRCSVGAFSCCLLLRAQKKAVGEWG